ncbi:hypothetical protein C8Q79DRAFT_932365 [Trametes meyenii]|nr:hypothetical protein C8Q79DRAFT_932365 [Trametes meyenii]
MLWRSLRIPRFVPLLRVRSYARNHHDGPTRTTADALLASYRKHCSNPAFALVHASGVPVSPQLLEQALRSSATLQHEYDEWEPVATEPSLARALSRAQSLLASKHATSQPLPSDLPRSDIPTWALASLLSNSPETKTEAFVAHRLALAHHVAASRELAPLILVLAALPLIRLRMYAPLLGVVLRFVRSTKELENYHVALFLRALAQADPAPEIEPMFALILQLALDHDMELSGSTYLAVVNNRAASRAVGHLIELHMQKLCFAPNLALTRSLVRLFAENGSRKTAARYWHRIRQGEFYGQVPPYIWSEQFQSSTLDDYLKSFKDTKKANYYVRYLLKITAQSNQDANAYGVLPMRPLLPSSDGLSPRAWLKVLSTAAVDRRMPTDRLLALYRQGRQGLIGPVHALVARFLVIKSLLRRWELNEVAPLLTEALTQKDLFDTTQLTVAIEALTMLDRPDVALHLLQHFHQPGPTLPHLAQIDVRTVNTFMIALLRIGRPDAVFYIWDTLPALFPAVEPDSVSLAILLKTARFARKCEGALQVALADFGLRHLLPRRRHRPAPAADPLSRKNAMDGLERLLGDGAPATGFWRGERAGVVALRLVWRVLVGNWPTLAAVRSPVHAVRRNAASQALAPVADFLHSASLSSRDGAADGGPFGPGSGSGGGEGGTRSGPVVPVDEDGRTYFGIGPHDVMFRALLDLLADEDCAGQIPRVLAWMRHLRVRPSRETLAVALVYWGEVSLGGPLIERWKGEGRSGYGRLEKWMSRWVGRRNMPRREETQRALSRVKWFREMGRYGEGREKVELQLNEDASGS